MTEQKLDLQEPVTNTLIKNEQQHDKDIGRELIVTRQHENTPIQREREKKSQCLTT